MTGLDISPYLALSVVAAVLLGMGFVLGVLTGLFGVGGGFLIIPLLTVGLGLDYSVAKGSSLACILGGSVSGLMRHSRLGNVAIKTMLIISGGAVSGAVLGGLVNDAIEQAVNGNQHLMTLIMHPLYILLLLVVAWLVFRGSNVSPREQTLLQRLPIGPRIRIRLANRDDISLPGLVCLGLLIGALAGLLGVSGIFTVPLLLVAVGLTPQQAVGTSLGVVVFASAAGTVTYAMTDQVNLWITMSMLIGSTLGVQFGAWLSHVLRAGDIRRWFAILVLLVATMIALDFVVTLTNG